MNELALFAGAGGGILGGHLLGWRTVCAVERDAYAAGVLLARQNDGSLSPFPVWDDVRTFDGRPWRGVVDVVSGGFPCQDISVAGKGGGITGARSGLWAEMARIIGEVGPRFVLVENSPALTRRGLDRVLSDLASLGFDAEWGVLGASVVDAPHKRDRIWIFAYLPDALHGRRRELFQSQRVAGSVVAPDARGDGASQLMADADGSRELQPQGAIGDERGRPGDSGSSVSDADSAQREGVRRSSRTDAQHTDVDSAGAWWRFDPADDAKSGVGRVANGVAHRVDRLRALGNGQVPAVVRLAWNRLSERVDD